MNRRQFLSMAGVATAASVQGCTWPSWCMVPPWMPVKVLYAGQKMGHLARDAARQRLPKVHATRTVDTLILGSGMAGLSAAWRLAQQGHTDVLMLDGVERDGNASAGQWRGLSYSRGAHYLPFPTPESTHVQAILRDLQLWQGNDPATGYAETDVVFAPSERLWQNGAWHSSLIPQVVQGSESARQLAQFLAFTDGLKGLRGADGRVIFAIPVAYSSLDPLWRKLDKISFKTWLTEQGYRSPELLWYLNYSCQDDYGAGIDVVSAWAGLHYFASRVHEREQADHLTATPLLTWPNGLQHLAHKMATRRPISRLAMTAIRLQTHADHAQVLAIDERGKTLQIRARRVISAMPLQVLRHVWTDAAAQGLAPDTALLPQVPWLVCNVYLDGVLPEKTGAPLSWENIVYGSASQGFVNRNHQQLRASPAPYNVLTAYHAIADRSPQQARQWLQRATIAELLHMGLQDVYRAYGVDLWRYVAGVEVCVRGHAMSAPAVGFLNHATLAHLRGLSGVLHVAHSDLSGYSVFEEASFWGVTAAERMLAD